MLMRCSCCNVNARPSAWSGSTYTLNQEGNQLFSSPKIQDVLRGASLQAQIQRARCAMRGVLVLSMSTTARPRPSSHVRPWKNSVRGAAVVH